MSFTRKRQLSKAGILNMFPIGPGGSPLSTCLRLAAWPPHLGGLFLVCGVLLSLTSPSAAQPEPGKPAPERGEPQNPSGEEAPAAPKPQPKAGESGEASATAPQTARANVILFVGEDPVIGAEIGLVGGSTDAVMTDSVGSASLAQTQGGEFELWAKVPRENVPDAPAGDGPIQVSLQTITLVLGETVEVIATLKPDGNIDTIDVESVAGSVQAAREVDAKATAENVPLGTVSGKVLDSETGQPVEGARVFVRGSDAEAVTDGAGAFRLELPEGNWGISVIHPDYSTMTEPDVAVSSEKAGVVKFELLPASTVLEDFIITVPHVEGSVASVLSERRESASMSDAISAEDISKSGSSDAAGAAQRVVGVTIVGGKFVYVRGLGERYTNALLNGSPMPSPEPDKATVPLDLLPTQVIRSIDIAKTSTPDFPADFAGGSVRIETVTVPEEPIFAIKLKANYNSQSTFRKRADFPSSSTDFLGFDDGMRALPDSAPSDYELRRGATKPDGERVSSDEIQESSKDFNSAMVPKNRRNLPDMGGSVIWGRGWDLGEKVRLGTLAALSYNREETIKKETIRQFRPAGVDQPLQTWIEGNSVSATDNVTWAAFGSLGLAFLEHHEISLVGLRSQIADDNTRFVDLYSGNVDADYKTIRNGYTSRSLEFAQVRGQHTFPILFDGHFDWRLTLGRALLDQPDMRDTVYFKNRTGDVWAYAAGSGSGRHFYADLVENARSAFADYTQPIVKGDLEKKFKFGGGANGKKRVFKTRRFNFSASGADTVCGEEFDLSCPEDLFTDENIDDGVLGFAEGTLENDAYRASANVYAGYAMLDFKLFKPLRAIGGLRLEQTDQFVSAYNQFDPENREGIDDVEFKSTDWLPSASLVFTATDWMEFRGAFSKTVARPQLRELAPFQFADYFGGVTVNGNPELKLTKVTNYDLRMDIFPSPAEVISVSGFIKDFVDPIEPILRPSGTAPIQTYQNAQGAFLYGMELEARKGLGFVSDALEYFSLMGNLTLANSQIELNQTGSDESGMVVFITNTERRMVNQAPYVVNFAVDFEIPNQTQARLLFNVSGKQVVNIGTEGLEDQYQHPRPSLDFTFSQRLAEHWRLGASVKNILNSRFVVTQGKKLDEDLITYAYRDGVSFGLSLGYSL